MTRALHSTHLRHLIERSLELKESIIRGVSGEPFRYEPSELRAIIAQAGTPEEDETLVRVVAEELSRGNRLPPKDIVDALAVLERAREAIISSLSIQYGEIPEVSGNPRAAEILEMLMAEKETKDSRKEVVLDIIRSKPGLNLAELERACARHVSHGLGYTTIWNYVEELERAEAIITVGGSKGYERYCFPHPKSIESWSEYYYRFFCVEGAVVSNLSEKFHQLPTTWRDLYLVNGMVKPTVVITRFDQTDLATGEYLRVFGRLGRFTDLHTLGLEPLPEIKKNIEKCDILQAAEIALPGSEEPIYRDPDLMKLREKLVAP